MPSPTPPATDITSLQIGMGWFPEQPDGLNRVFQRLLAHLPAAGVAASGLVAGGASTGAGSGGHVAAFGPIDASLLRRWRGARRAVRHRLAQAPPHLVASHFALYAFPVLDLVRPYPLVVHFHGPWASESRLEGAARPVVAAKRALERAVYRRAERLITLSSAFRDVLVRDYGIDPGRIAVVPGGVTFGRFADVGSRPEARLRLGWPADRPLVLTVRRLRPRMGLENLIDALGLVRRRVPDVLLLIAGKGPLDALLQARIRSAGLADHVRLLGFVPDEALPLAYRAADLTIMPTVALEGFGLPTVESLAAGTPVLVTPVGGLPEVVQPLGAELVLPGYEPAVLADGLVGGLTGGLRLPDAAACRAYVRERFDWPAVAAQVRAVYEEVV